MPKVSLSQSQAVGELAELLYDFLPGKPHPYANQDVSFLAAARASGLVWPGGSKLPAIHTVLLAAVENGVFSKFLIQIVRRALIYKGGVTREKIETVNSVVKKIGFRISELYDPDFLDSLPSEKRAIKKEEPAKAAPGSLKKKLYSLADMDSQARGYAFQEFLTEIFDAYGLKPRRPFRITGEEIDGSIDVDGEIYLVEAKWWSQPISEKEMLVFREKVESKSAWARGIIISYSGFSKDGIRAFATGRATNIIGISGQDLHFILENLLSLKDAILRKARRAAETGQFFVSVYELI